MKLYKNLKTLLAVTSLAAILSSSCMSREQAFGGNPEAVTFHDPVVYPLPDISWVEKRAFNDFTCDGITDMVEIEDEQVFGQDYWMKVFPGYLNLDGVVQFSEPYKVKILVEYSWLSGTSKFDSADINGDSCSDIVLSLYQEDLIGKDFVERKILLNQGDGKTFASLDDTSPISALSETYSDCEGWHGSKESSSNYRTLDWANADGKNGDDLLVFCSNHTDLIVEIYTTKIGGDGSLINDRNYVLVLNNFMLERDLSEIDTEDFNGDGIADIILPYYWGYDAIVSIALGGVASNEGLEYHVQKDSGVITLPSLDLLSYDKTDFYEADGRKGADFAVIGKKDGKPVIVYTFAKQEETNNILNYLGMKLEDAIELLEKQLKYFSDNAPFYK